MRQGDDEFLVLRSNQFADDADHETIFELGEKMVERVNPIVRNLTGHSKVSCAATVHIDETGKVRRHYVLRAEPIVVRPRVGIAELHVYDADGREITQQKSSSAQDMLTAAMQDENIGKALGPIDIHDLILR